MDRRFSPRLYGGYRLFNDIFSGLPRARDREVHVSLSLINSSVTLSTQEQVVIKTFKHLRYYRSITTLVPAGASAASVPMPRARVTHELIEVLLD